MTPLTTPVKFHRCEAALQEVWFRSELFNQMKMDLLTKIQFILKEDEWRWEKD